MVTLGQYPLHHLHSHIMILQKRHLVVRLCVSYSLDGETHSGFYAPRVMNTSMVSDRNLNVTVMLIMASCQKQCICNDESERKTVQCSCYLCISRDALVSVSKYEVCQEHLRLR